MKNRGKRAALALLLLGALLLLSGCVREDLSIVGVEPGQPGPESGQLRILFAMNIGNPPSPTMTIDDVSLSKVSFTITNEDTNEQTVVTNPTIDRDPAISYARFDEKGNMIEHQLGILIPYTLKPGHYRVTDVKGDVLYPSADGVVNRSLSVNTSYNTSFTIAAPTPTPTPDPLSTLPYTDGQLYAAAYLGYQAPTDLDFFRQTYFGGRELPVHHISDGDFYLIIPRDPNATVRLLRNDMLTQTSSIFYEQPDGSPFVIGCNVSDIFPDVTVEITASDGEKVSFSPFISLKDGSVEVGERGLNITRISTAP